MPKQTLKTTSSRMIKKIPISENGMGVLCKTKSGKEYRISQNIERRKHILWRKVDDGFEKIATAESPYDLYPMIDWDE